MPKIGWPALFGLGALFVIISALVGGEGNQGVLGQMASHSAGQDSEASENAATRDTPINLAEMPDEVAPEAEDDEFGKPVVDEVFSDDFADLSDVSGEDEWVEVSESTLAARSRPPQSSGRPDTSARSADRESASAPLTGNDALMRDLRNSGLFEGPPGTGR